MSIYKGTTQVAGIPTGLINTVNNKADANSVYTKTEVDTNFTNINASNLSTTGKSTISGLGMPSNNYINLTLGASGSTYTAPANGWLNVTFLSATMIQIYNTTSGNFWNTSVNTSSQEALGCIMPCKKGDILQVYYAKTIDRWFRFYYAEGETGV